MTTVPPPAGTYVPPGTTPPPQQPPQKSSGCLKWLAIGCGALLVLACIAVVAVVMFAFAAMRRTDVYREAFTRASNDPRVIEALGTPIEDGWWLTGRIDNDHNDGVARITFPISGPKGKARVHFSASRENDAWSYSSIIVRPEKGGEIDVLHH